LARANYTDTAPVIEDTGQPLAIDQSWSDPVLTPAWLAFGADHFFDAYMGVTAETGGFVDATGAALPENEEPLNKSPALAAIDNSGLLFGGGGNNYNDPRFPPFDTVGGFRSIHPGGANFCFADGSVHYITTSIDINTYKALSTFQGGEIVSGASAGF
jgi:prepilin-type processing-associated H-X9-DG protein